MTFIFFNIFVNSILSLFGGLLIVFFFLWLFRIETGPWKLFLFSLPFVKIVYDCLRGVPKQSILFSHVDIFSLPPKHHTLTLGAGANQWGPDFHLQFTVKDLQGNQYVESMGDYLALWLHKTFGNIVPLMILCIVASISLLLLGKRLWKFYRFELERSQDRKVATPLRKVSTLLRSVDIYLSPSFSGTPFTGGLLHPYICIPLSTQQKLSAAELESVLAHELAHIKRFDLLGTITIQILGDLFWFIPGYRWLSKKMDHLREIVADQWAIDAGANPTLLASALLKLKDGVTEEKFVLYSAFFRQKSLLKTRIHRLLEKTKDPKPRFGWQNKWIRIVVTFWICTAVMTNTFGGNHRFENAQISPAWLHHFLQKWGLSDS